MKLVVSPWSSNSGSNIRMNMAKIVMGMSSFVINSNNPETKSGDSRIEVEYNEEILNKLYIVSHWRKTEVNIIELWDWLHEMSIKIWDLVVINSIFRKWLFQLSEIEIKKIIAIADIINACQKKFESRVDEKMWNARFKVYDNLFFGFELYFEWLPETNIISEKWLIALFKWEVPSKLSILISAVKGYKSRLFSGEESKNPIERRAYMNYDCKKEADWIVKITASERPLSDLLKKLAEYLNSEI